MSIAEAQPSPRQPRPIDDARLLGRSAARSPLEDGAPRGVPRGVGVTRHLFGRPFAGSTASLLEAASAPPHPEITLQDEDGRVLRIEGPPGGMVVEGRRFEGARLVWEIIGRAPPETLSLPLRLAGEIRSLRRSEHLEVSEALEVAAAFEAADALPTGFIRRPHDGEDGRSRVLASVEHGPRPVAAWAEVERFLAAESGGGFALSVPDRQLVAVLPRGSFFEARLRNFRPFEGSAPIWTREVEVRRDPPDPTPFPVGDLSRRRDLLLDAAELRTLLESLYRYETTPPGFREVEVLA